MKTMTFAHLRSLRAFCSCILVSLFSFFIGQNAIAQTYSGTEIFGDMNQYSFDWTIVCSADGTSATLTADFTAPPPGLVPQIHLGGGVFEAMVGPNPYTYTFTGLTACNFSFQFWIAYAGGLYAPPFIDQASLPISLIDFFATERSGREIYLEWSTANEINSDYFSIERSTDGRTWDITYELDASGTSNTEKKYSYIDDNLDYDRSSTVTLYYRLKMIDLDGTFQYSHISNVRLNSTNQEIYIYPNPTSSFLNFSLDSGQRGSIRNYRGQLVKSLTFVSGDNKVDVGSLPNGMYIFTIESGVKKIFVKQ